MLRTPTDFEPDLALELDDDAIAHVFVRDALVQFAQTPGGLPWRFYREAGLAPAGVHPVGRHVGRAHVAIALPDETDPRALPEGLKASGLRSWFGVLDDATLAIAMRAVQLVEWDRTHRFCGACGTQTERIGGERAKRCPACGLTAYPRISPAMMVMVTRGREMLMGRGINFPPGRYSALAGFVEAGETIEEAVVREVREEVGVEVRDLRYFGSQSWPFPNSLMIGYRAKWAGGEIEVDGEEILEADWFSAKDMPSFFPGRVSIAQWLIHDFLRRNGVEVPE